MSNHAAFGEKHCAPADLIALQRYLQATAAVCVYSARATDERELLAALKILRDMPRLLDRLPFGIGDA